MREIVHTLRPYLLRYRRGLALGVVALLLRNLAGASLPLVIGVAVVSL